MASLLGINTDSGDLADLRHRGGDGGGGRGIARPVLRRHQPLHRLYGRYESLHRRGSGRYRQHSRRDDRRRLGVAEALTSAYLSTEYKDVVSFALLIVVLLIMPTILRARPEVEKV